MPVTGVVLKWNDSAWLIPGAAKPWLQLFCRYGPSWRSTGKPGPRISCGVGDPKNGFATGMREEKWSRGCFMPQRYCYRPWGRLVQLREECAFSKISSESVRMIMMFCLKLLPKKAANDMPWRHLGLYEPFDKILLQGVGRMYPEQKVHRLSLRRLTKVLRLTITWRLLPDVTVRTNNHKQSKGMTDAEQNRIENSREGNGIRLQGKKHFCLKTRINGKTKTKMLRNEDGSPCTIRREAEKSADGLRKILFCRHAGGDHPFYSWSETKSLFSIHKHQESGGNETKMQNGNLSG